MRGRAWIALALGIVLACPASASASTVFVVGGEDDQLFYEAGPGEVNRLVMESEGLGVTITDTGAEIEPGAACTEVTAHEVTCSANGGVPVEATLRGGNDRVRVNGAFLSLRAFGGAGSDRLKGGPNLDFLDGGTGPDVMNGAGGAADFASYLERSDDLTVTLGDGKRNDGGRKDGPRRDRLTSIEGVAGGAGNDVLVGTEIENNFNGQAGADRLRGRGGDDSLHVDAGRDKAVGGAGDDLFTAGDGPDEARGGPGADTFQMAGDENGADRFAGGGGHDLLQGGSFGTIFVNLDGQANDGVCADDPCTFSDEGDNALGIEEVSGGFGGDVLIGSNGDETLRPFQGADTVRANDGDDTLLVFADMAPDLLDCGAGTDTVSGGTDGSDTLLGCE